MRKKSGKNFQDDESIKQKDVKSTPSRKFLQRKQSLGAQDMQQIPQRLQQSYEALKKSQQSLSNTAAFSQNNKALLYLKQLYMKEQSVIVKGIKQMSEQSRHIIEDLNNIEGQIDKYQIHIDEWIKKIEQLSGNVSKIRSVQSSFKKKAANMSKLKQFLNVQKPKRR